MRHCVRSGSGPCKLQSADGPQRLPAAPSGPWPPEETEAQGRFLYAGTQEALRFTGKWVVSAKFGPFGSQSSTLPEYVETLTAKKQKYKLDKSSLEAYRKAPPVVHLLININNTLVHFFLLIQKHFINSNRKLNVISSKFLQKVIVGAGGRKNLL